jgi:hypothetical protein
LATPLHFNKLRIVLVIVLLAATVARMLAKSHDMQAAATLPGLEERERLKMKKLKLSAVLCLSAAVFIILRRNHSDETPSTEEDCSWLNHRRFPTKEFDGPLISKALILKEIESNLRFIPSELSQKLSQVDFQ